MFCKYMLNYVKKKALTLFSRIYICFAGFYKMIALLFAVYLISPTLAANLGITVSSTDLWILIKKNTALNL